MVFVVMRPLVCQYIRIKFYYQWGVGPDRLTFLIFLTSRKQVGGGEARRSPSHLN